MIDARGLSCPMPVVMVQRALKSDPAGVTVTVDNMAAVGNITRYAGNYGYDITDDANGAEHTLTLKKKD